MHVTELKWHEHKAGVFKVAGEVVSISKSNALHCVAMQCSVFPRIATLNKLWPGDLSSGRLIWLA